MLRTLATFGLLLLLCAGTVARAAPSIAPSVTVLTVNGGIDPATAEYLVDGLSAANSTPATALVIIRLDTPGGLGDSMDHIVQAILASRAPVCVFVAPAGARAASAGAIIALAANLVAMAPATNIGAATPIEGMTGRDLGQKIKNDAAARARALATLRHRPVNWAQRVVLKAESVTVDEAIQQHLADVKATDVGDLLRKLDGRPISGHPLALRSAAVHFEDMPLRLSVLHFLADPNIAYILLLLAIYGIIAEFSHPGAVFPGVAGAICALLAFYALAVLSVNVVGLLLILLAVGLFVGDAVLTAHGSLALGGAVSFCLGSFILIRSPLGTVSPLLIGIATLLTVLLMLGIITLAVRTRRRPAVVGKESMVGGFAVARTALEPNVAGRVLFEGTFWNAVSPEPVRKGERVEVTGVDGLTLQVRPIHQWTSADADRYAAE